MTFQLASWANNLKISRHPNESATRRFMSTATLDRNMTLAIFDRMETSLLTFRIGDTSIVSTFVDLFYLYPLLALAKSYYLILV